MSTAAPATFEQSPEYQAWQAKQQERHDETRKAEVQAKAALIQQAEADRKASEDKLAKLTERLDKARQALRDAEAAVASERARAFAVSVDITRQINAHDQRLISSAPQCIDTFVAELAIVQDARGRMPNGVMMHPEAMTAVHAARHAALRLKLTAITDADAESGIAAIRQTIDEAKARAEARQAESAALASKLYADPRPYFLATN